MIGVLVVEDSSVLRELMVNILSSDPAIRVMGTAKNGEEALEAVERLKPDIVTMDVHMPKMNGLDATRRIMETHPTPVVVVSGSFEPDEFSRTFRALEAGALAVLSKPAGVGHPDHQGSSAELIRTVKVMSEVKVVRRWVRPVRPAPPAVAAVARESAVNLSNAEVRLIVIGASTGGPLALQMILDELPHDFRVPILVVQHIAPGFIRGFVDWLNQTSKVLVGVATHGELVAPSRAYIAPDGFQMMVGVGGRIMLTTDEPVNGLRPSVACLFRSAAHAYGQHALGILLTGMGRDGAEELRTMKEHGSVTIAQDEDSSVVYGMPGEANRIGGATYVLSPARIAKALGTLVVKRETAQ